MVAVGRFAQDSLLARSDGVRSDEQPLRKTLGNIFGFLRGEALDEVAWRFVFARRVLCSIVGLDYLEPTSRLA